MSHGMRSNLPKCGVVYRTELGLLVCTRDAHDASEAHRDDEIGLEWDTRGALREAAKEVA